MAAEEYVREYLQYGGQAIVEGVMMRSPHFFSVACRAPNGEIVVRTEAIESTWVGRQKWLKYPFLRGTLALLDSMALGSRAMKFASKVQLDDEYQPIEPPKDGEVLATSVDVLPAATSTLTGDAAPVVKSSNKIQDGAVVATIVISLVLGVFIFDVIPNMIAEQAYRIGVTNPTVKNLVSESSKTIIFLGYMALLGLSPDIRRVFCFHGAEHKAINTLESGHELELENCKLQTRLHPRCGTSFAIIVLILGFVIFTFVPRYPIPNLPKWENIVVRVLVETAILPLIAGVSYELIRLAGKFRSTTLVNILFRPGLWSQLLTTREPDEEQIEVALVALREVVTAEKGFGKPAAVTPTEAIA